MVQSHHCLKPGCEIIGHGISVSQMITSDMSEEAEREYIQQSVAAIKRFTGAAPTGWLGPEYGESSQTPQLLAQAGIRYVCDWANDEQHYAIKVPQGQLFALPLMIMVLKQKTGPRKGAPNRCWSWMTSTLSGTAE